LSYIGFYIIYFMIDFAIIDYDLYIYIYGSLHIYIYYTFYHTIYLLTTTLLSTSKYTSSRV